MSEALTVEAAREQARALVERLRGLAFTFRSCWRCNAAHEHLRDPNRIDHVIACPWCNRYYYRGLDITEAEGRA